MNYYRKQLNKVNPLNSEYNPTFKIMNENGSTKWMDLNFDSANELIIWLAENYYPSFMEAKKHVESNKFEWSLGKNERE